MAITDSFTGANGTGIEAYSANWAYMSGSGTNFQIQSNGLAMGAVSLEGGAKRTEAGFPSNHYAQITVAVENNANPSMGVAVRCQAAGSADYYGLYSGGAALEMFEYDGTTWSQIGSSGAGFVATDLVRLTVSGTTLTPSIDGVTANPPNSQTDATYSGGAPGICGFNAGDATANTRIDDFECSGIPIAAVTGTATATINEADVVAGGETVIVTLTEETFVAASVTTAITQPASANGGTGSTTSFSITCPTTQANDILILEFCHRGLGLGTIAGTTVSTGGLTWTHKHTRQFATDTFSGQMYWTRATGNHSGQTVTGASLTNACAAILKVKRGCVESGDPFTNAATIVGEANASGNETQAEITTLIDGAEVNLTILNSPDLAVATHACTSPGALGSEVEVLSTGGTDASISSACAVKATAGATGAFTWTQTDAAGGSYAYALEPKVTTPFNDARQAIIDGLDSAQSEATGWNNEVRDNLAVTTVARTSDTVCTITLSAQAAYDITAQETITVTVPATALNGGAPITATPTFTVDTDGGAPDPSTIIFLACDMRNIDDMGGTRG